MIELIQQRLATYQAKNSLEEEQATKEILQEIALYCLWRADFFEVAAFQGGTSLRILHQLPRFSEDLDFILKSPDSDFSWNHYLPKLIEGLKEFGLQSEVLDRSNMDRNIREALLKDNSIGNQLNLRFYDGRPRPTLKIKLEIDVNPPAGSAFDYTYLDFPLDYEVCHQDLASNFALKIHALLCRPYIKGRDWYNLTGTSNNALDQTYHICKQLYSSMVPGKIKASTSLAIGLPTHCRKKLEQLTGLQQQTLSDF